MGVIIFVSSNIYKFQDITQSPLKSNLSGKGVRRGYG